MNVEEMKNVIAKEFGVYSIASPLGSCTENFLNSKILQVATKNNFPPNIIDKFMENSYKFRSYQEFDNGRLSGKYFIALLEDME